MLNYSVRFYNKKWSIDKTVNEWAISQEPDDLGQINWNNNQIIDQTKILSEPNLQGDKLAYSPLSGNFKNISELGTLKKEFSDYLYRNRKYVISWHEKLGLYQSQSESKSDFMVKLRQAAREERDEEIDKLERKYDSKLDSINSKIDRYMSKLSSEKDEHEARKREEVFGVGETVLGLLLGRRRSTGLTTASRRRRMTTKSKNKIDELEREIKELQEELGDLEFELSEQVGGITAKWERVDSEIDEYVITPRRSDVSVDDLKIVWVYNK